MLLFISYSDLTLLLKSLIQYFEVPLKITLNKTFIAQAAAAKKANTVKRKCIKIWSESTIASQSLHQKKFPLLLTHIPERNDRMANTKNKLLEFF